MPDRRDELMRALSCDRFYEVTDPRMKAFIGLNDGNLGHSRIPHG